MFAQIHVLDKIYWRVQRFRVYQILQITYFKSLRINNFLIFLAMFWQICNWHRNISLSTAGQGHGDFTTMYHNYQSMCIKNFQIRAVPLRGGKPTRNLWEAIKDRSSINPLSPTTNLCWENVKVSKKCPPITVLSYGLMWRNQTGMIE